MNNATLEKLLHELKKDLTGQKFGRIFILQKLQIAVDFRLHESKFLFIRLEPSAPRVYLIKRKLKDLEKRAQNPSPFFLFLRKRLSNAVVKTIEKYPSERILSFELTAQNDLGQNEIYYLIVQLTGRSANLFLLDENKFILDSLR